MLAVRSYQSKRLKQSQYPKQACNWIILSFTRHGCLYSKGRWERGKVFNASDVIQTIISCSANHMSRVVDHRWCQDWYPLQISNPVNTVEDEEDRGRHPECPGVNVVTEGLLVGRHRLSRTASLGLLQNRESPSHSYSFGRRNNEHSTPI